MSNKDTRVLVIKSSTKQNTGNNIVRRRESQPQMPRLIGPQTQEYVRHREHHKQRMRDRMATGEKLGPRYVKKTQQQKEVAHNKLVERRKTCWLIVADAFNETYGRECTECGHTGPYCHFDWAHWKREGKRSEISRLLISGNLTGLLKEMPKVRLLCKFCHAEETARETNAAHAFD